MSLLVAEPRFIPGQRILARRSGNAGAPHAVAEILRNCGGDELYHVRWNDGLESYFVPGPDAHDRRRCDLGPPRGHGERRRG
jgi:hypothetical protein